MWFIDLAENFQYFIVNLGQRHPVEIMWIIFANGGWIIFAVVILWGFWESYMLYIKTKYANSRKWTLLAIDIPKENLQSTKAVEHIFAAMWPYLESINLIEKYIQGKFQQAFSLEIVSIRGYTQFLIRVMETHKDIVEAAVYAQYPKAEISEVEDYTLRYKDLRFPSDELDLWGSEFYLSKPSPYPIRTYTAFEHTLTQQFADPMASFLEVFDKIDKDEELWFQLVITPIKDKWKEEGYKIINKIIGAKEEGKKGILGVLLSPFNYLFTLLEELIIYGIGYEPGKVEEGQANMMQQVPNKMLYLTPEEKNIVEGISAKISKLAYQTKLRMIYIAPKEKMNKPKGVAASIGALNQFSAMDLNAIVPNMHTFTKANYFMVKRRVIWRQNRILRNFRNRTQTSGWGKGFVFNIEELASMFHLPIPEAVREAVKAVEAQKEAPPADLPDVEYEEEKLAETISATPAVKAKAAKAEPPVDLPV